MQQAQHFLLLASGKILIFHYSVDPALQDQVAEFVCIGSNPTFILVLHREIRGFPSGSAVKNSPAVQETLAPSLGLEDPLEEAMATHSSILAWRILWREEAGRLQSMGSQESKKGNGQCKVKAGWLRSPWIEL